MAPARAGSERAAAHEIGITTPALRNHLALMESRLGASLLSRMTRRSSLTPEGELYLKHARRILGQIDDMAQLLGHSGIATMSINSRADEEAAYRDVERLA